MVSLIIPTLSPTPELERYVSQFSQYPSVGEVIVVVNGIDQTPSPRHGGELPQGSNSFPREGTASDAGKGVWHYLGKNTGFTGACNAGAKLAKGELLLFLNDDCEITESALSTLVQFMRDHRDVVATQPTVYKRVPSSKFQIPSENNTNSIIKSWIPDQVRDDTMTAPSPANMLPDPQASRPDIENIGFWVDTKIGKAYPVRSTDQITNDELRITNETNGFLDSARNDTIPAGLPAYGPIYGLSGTCLLIRKDIFEKVGMFDESFHSYLEDVDLAIRLHKAGYKVAPCLDASVTHEHMATSSTMGLYKEMQDVKNWWRLVFKHPDVFVHWSTLISLLLERGRNVSGLMKKLRYMGIVLSLCFSVLEIRLHS